MCTHTSTSTSTSKRKENAMSNLADNRALREAVDALTNRRPDEELMVAPPELPKPPVVDEPPPQEDITKKTVLLRVTLRSLGVRRTLPKSLVTVDADKSMLHFSKDIL